MATNKGRKSPARGSKKATLNSRAFVTMVVVCLLMTFVLFSVSGCGFLDKIASELGIITPQATFVFGYDIESVTIEALDGKYTPPTASRTGYELTAWYTDDGLTELADFNKTATDGVTYYAKWTAIRYAISYDYDEKATAGQGSVASYTIEDEVSLVSPTVTNEEYVFLYWIDENEARQSSIPRGSTGNKSFTAVYELKNNGDNTESEDGIGTANSFRYNSVLSGKSDFSLPSELDGTCLEVHFINVGQGDGIVIMLPDGKIFIIDAGSGSRQYAPKAISTQYETYLTDNLNVDEVDYLLITHPDTDHYNMVASKVLDAYVVRNVFYNNFKDSDKKKTYTNFLADKVEKEAGATLYPVNETSFYHQVSDVNYGYVIDIYAPGDTGFSGAESKWNSMSLMCVLSYGGRKVMFTGDAEVQTEAWFMETVGGTELDVDVLKVGHHGSRSCTSTSFVEFIKPEYAVISCDDGTEYGHPHQETMTTLNTYGVATYRTNRHGNIVLYMDEDGDFMFLPQYVSTVENNSKNIDAREIVLEPAA